MAATTEFLARAETALNHMFTAQPNIVSGARLTPEAGKALAGFCIAFIESYAEHLETREKRASP